MTSLWSGRGRLCRIVKPPRWNWSALLFLSMTRLRVEIYGTGTMYGGALEGKPKDSYSPLLLCQMRRAVQSLRRDGWRGQDRMRCDIGKFKR